jgi:hypothetical protein
LATADFAVLLAFAPAGFAATTGLRIVAAAAATAGGAETGAADGTVLAGAWSDEGLAEGVMTLSCVVKRYIQFISFREAKSELFVKVKCHLPLEKPMTQDELKQAVAEAAADLVAAEAPVGSIIGVGTGSTAINASFTADCAALKARYPGKRSKWPPEALKEADAIQARFDDAMDTLFEAMPIQERVA